MEAALAWGPAKLGEAKEPLQKSGMTDEQAETKMRCGVKLFIECVPRVALPPRLLCWRARSAFAPCSPKKGSKKHKPLQ